MIFKKNKAKWNTKHPSELGRSEKDAITKIITILINVTDIVTYLNVYIEFTSDNRWKYH